MVIVFTINTVYIRRLTSGTDATRLLVIQILFAGFKVMYSVMVVPLLCKPITDMKKAIWMRLRIYMFNSIWVPVLAALRTSPACFEVGTSCILYVRLLADNRVAILFVIPLCVVYYSMLCYAMLCCAVL